MLSNDKFAQYLDEWPFSNSRYFKVVCQAKQIFVNKKKEKNFFDVI